MKFGFVAKHRGIWPVALMCGALGVSRGGFYSWLDRPRSQREIDDDELGKRIKQSFIDSDRTYGARRVWFDVLALSFECGLHRIERLMQGWSCAPGRAGVACPRTRACAARSPTTCWIASSRPTHRTRSGWLTSPTSGRPRAGCTWPWCWTCSPGALWDGRCRTT